MMTAISQGFLPPSGFSQCETIGVTPATSSGTVIDPGATQNTKGTPVLLGTLGRPCSALLLVIGGQGTGTNTARYFIDIGLDSACTNVILPNLGVVAHSASDMIMPNTIGPFPFCLPANTSLYARAQCSITTTPRTIELALYAFG